jgi:hypothetical protein
MIEVMHNVILNVTKVAFATSAFIGISINKMTTINNIKWLSIHLYVVQAWKMICILLFVKTCGVFAMTLRSKHVSMSMSLWTWTYEQEWIFLEYSNDMEIIFVKNFTIVIYIYLSYYK